MRYTTYPNGIPLLSKIFVEKYVWKYARPIVVVAQRLRWRASQIWKANIGINDKYWFDSTVKTGVNNNNACLYIKRTCSPLTDKDIFFLNLIFHCYFCIYSGPRGGKKNCMLQISRKSLYFIEYITNYMSVNYVFRRYHID